MPVTLPRARRAIVAIYAIVTVIAALAIPWRAAAGQGMRVRAERPKRAPDTSQPIAADEAATLLPAKAVSALAAELSGEGAKRNLEYLTRLHRMPGSPDFHLAIEFVATQARAAGLSDVHVDSFPADGKIFYGTQRSRPAWWTEFAELWEVGGTAPNDAATVRIASWEQMPITLADM